MTTQALPRRVGLFGLLLVQLELLGGALARPYRVTPSMVLLVSLVPLYIFIPALFPARNPHAPAIALDLLVPLRPSWALVYGPLYLFLILLPVVALRDPDHIRRTVFAYLAIWITAYAFFLTYPTVAPRPTEVVGSGFGVWALRSLYGADTPYNCFPSLHVAHSFVSALSCSRLHRGVGLGAGVAAFLVALSTLFTKQHYVLDLVAGILLASLAYTVFLARYPRNAARAVDRQAAPVVAVALVAVVALVTAGAWLVQRSYGS